MNKKKILQRLAAICLSGGVAASWAAVAAGLSEADSHFLQAAAAADAFQVQAASLARERAASTEVRTFAAKMQAQHQEDGAGLKRLAASKQVTLPDQPEPADQRTLETLAGKTGTEFDALYTDQVAVAAHAKTDALYRDAARQAGDAQVREFAAQAGPRQADHLTLARALKRDPAARQDQIQPATRGEPPAVSPAAREAPASVAPEK